MRITSGGISWGRLSERDCYVSSPAYCRTAEGALGVSFLCDGTRRLVAYRMCAPPGFYNER